MLITINNVLSREQVTEFNRQLEQSEWIDGRETAGALATEIKANLQVDDNSAVAKQLGANIINVLASHPKFISAALPLKLYPPKFNCYQHGGHYGTHVDNAIMHLPNSAGVLRTDLSATLFLSEPEDYEGGELTIETEYGVQEVKLNAGDMVLYPSTSLHQVKPVTEGRRVSAFFWIQSMVKDSNQRSLLFDLDQSIQTLTAERGNKDGEVTKLTGVYHNLIRLWAES